MVWPALGKFTIARTVARTYHEKGYPLGSFFFSKGSGDAESAASFFTTIAVQLATRDSQLRGNMHVVVKQNQQIGQQSLERQWQQLVLRGITGLSGDHSDSCVLIVVDALDECSEESSVRTLLRLFTELPPMPFLRLRILLTSRPELPIRHHFLSSAEDSHHTLILHHVAPDTVGADVNMYLSSEFAVIRQERGYTSEWPGDSILNQLTRSAAGLFIYAATACRFVRQGKKFAKQRLELVLDHSRVTDSQPERQLDEIYMAVLANAISPEYTLDEQTVAYTQVRLLLGALILLDFRPTFTTLGNLLEMSSEDIEETLEDLHAVLDISADERDSVKLHHPSFRDFMTDPRRCTNEQLCVNTAEVHTVLTRGCLQVMSYSLRQYVSGIKDLSAEAMQGLDDANQMTRELEYSCKHWMYHAARQSGGLLDGDAVVSFLSNHFLQWLEAMDWRKMSATTWLFKSWLQQVKVRPLHRFAALTAYSMIRLQLVQSSISSSKIAWTS